MNYALLRTVFMPDYTMHLINLTYMLLLRRYGQPTLWNGSVLHLQDRLAARVRMSLNLTGRCTDDHLLPK